MVRSRAVLNSQWERPSNFFLNLEKKNFLNKSIPELIDENGDTQTNMNKIMEMQYSYYSDLFTSKPTTPIPDSKYDYLTDNLPKLPEQQRDILDSDITIEELEFVIKQAKLNKAPGPDGYSNEFFKTCCNELIHWIFRSYKHAITINSLSTIINPALANTGYIRCYISCLCDQHRIYPVFGYPCTKQNKNYIG